MGKQVGKKMGKWGGEEDKEKDSNCFAIPPGSEEPPERPPVFQGGDSTQQGHILLRVNKVDSLFDKFFTKAPFRGHQVFLLIDFSDLFQPDGYGQSLCLLPENRNAALCCSEQ